MKHQVQDKSAEAAIINSLFSIAMTLAAILWLAVVNCFFPDTKSLFHDYVWRTIWSMPSLLLLGCSLYLLINPAKVEF